MNKFIPNPQVRAWIYGVLVAASAVAIGYGLITAEQGNLWLSLAGALLGLSNALALANTPEKGSVTLTPGKDSGYLDPDTGI